MIHTYKKFLESQNTTTDIIKIVDKIGFTVDSSDIIAIDDGYIIELDKNKVIRLSYNDISFYKKLLNKNIDGVVKVYSVGKVDNYNYAILENLNQLSDKNLLLYNNMIKCVLKFGKDFLHNNDSFESHIATLSDNAEAIKEIDNTFKNSNKIDELKLFNLMVDIFKNLNKLNIKKIGFSKNNLMQDKNGNIKMVDIFDVTRA